MDALNVNLVALFTSKGAIVKSENFLCSFAENPISILIPLSMFTVVHFVDKQLLCGFTRTKAIFSWKQMRMFLAFFIARYHEHVWFCHMDEFSHLIVAAYFHSSS